MFCVLGQENRSLSRRVATAVDEDFLIEADRGFNRRCTVAHFGTFKSIYVGNDKLSIS